MILTAVLRERCADDSEDSANSSDSEGLLAVSNSLLAHTEIRLSAVAVVKKTAAAMAAMKC
jgi:hypothetical protein